MRVSAKLTSNLIPIKATFTGGQIAVNGEVVNRFTYSQAEEYDGEYEVTSFLAAPSLTSSLILPTRDKLMRDNVTFYSVPTNEEYNDQGGVTLTIGG